MTMDRLRLAIVVVALTVSAASSGFAQDPRPPPPPPPPTGTLTVVAFYRNCSGPICQGGIWSDRFRIEVVANGAVRPTQRLRTGLDGPGNMVLTAGDYRLVPEFAPRIRVGHHYKSIHIVDTIGYRVAWRGFTVPPHGKVDLIMTHDNGGA